MLDIDETLAVIKKASEIESKDEEDIILDMFMKSSVHGDNKCSKLGEINSWGSSQWYMVVLNPVILKSMIEKIYQYDAEIIIFTSASYDENVKNHLSELCGLEGDIKQRFCSSLYLSSATDAITLNLDLKQVMYMPKGERLRRLLEAGMLDKNNEYLLLDNSPIHIDSFPSGKAVHATTQNQYNVSFYMALLKIVCKYAKEYKKQALQNIDNSEIKSIQTAPDKFKDVDQGPTFKMFASKRECKRKRADCSPEQQCPAPKSVGGRD